MENPKILFLTLNVFSLTGGIEKLSRIIGKALFEISIERNSVLNIFSMHDFEKDVNGKYFPTHIFSAFNKNRVTFFVRSIIRGLSGNVIILSHINLLLIGTIIKVLSPSTKLYMYAHGIEIWKPFGFSKRLFFKKVDGVICVSNFTKNKLIELHNIPNQKLIVLNNCLDPFLDAIPNTESKEQIKERFGFENGDFILLTLSRISAHDRDKGYEKVLRAIHELIPLFPQLKYVIGGKYDLAEKSWLDSLIKEMNLESVVKFSGFIPEAELSSYFKSADIYIMPSKKEGFGISFIEAMYYGLPVIAGNKDGSVDALDNGQFGVLIDPDNQKEISEALKQMILHKSDYVINHFRLVQKFGFNEYKKKLGRIVTSLIPT